MDHGYRTSILDALRVRDNVMCPEVLADAVNAALQIAPNAVLFIADNVVDAFTPPVGPEWDNIGTFPCLALPYDELSIEARINGSRQALYLRQTRITKQTPQIWPKLLLNEKPLGQPEEGFLVSACELVEVGGDIWCRGLTFFCLDAEGKFFDKSLVRYATTLQGEKDEAEGWGVVMRLLFALSLCHCDNATLENNAPPLALSKKRQKNGKLPLLHYKTLNVGPVMEKLRQHGLMANGSGVSKALHLCRGHFKDYRKGKGLFGKLNGLYWWDKMERGNVESGVVVKDYSMVL